MKKNRVNVCKHKKWLYICIVIKVVIITNMKMFKI